MRGRPTKWRPGTDLSDPKGWKAAGVSRWTWYAWRRQRGIRRNLYWQDRDWFGEAKKLVDQGCLRHLGDLCLQLGVPSETLQTWAVRYRDQCGLYDLIGDLPRPGGYYSGYAKHVTWPVIHAFNASRQRLIAEGVDELAATHKAADDAVAQFRTANRARRKARREAKFGPDANVPHRLTKAEAKRIAWAVRSELGRLRLEKFFREQGYSQKEIKRLMPPKRRPKETLAERGRRMGWSAKRKAVVMKAERWAIERVRGWYGQGCRCG